jgi:ABC-type transport system involved in multi-copper enzyme maturation permease subunit
MIWLTWRQLRAQVTVAGAALGALAIYLVLLGLAVRHAYDSGPAACSSGDACNAARIAFTGRFETEFTLLSCLIIALPGLLGAFWGAPTVAREMETGTYRLIWTQGATRRSWLTAKLAGVTLSSAALTGVAAALLTWAAAPYEHVNSRFSVLAFDAHHVVPIAYAALATVLGVLVGLTVKRIVPAMALTLAIFAVVQIAVPLTLRAHLVAPVQRTVHFDQAAITGRPLTFDESSRGGTTYVGYTVAGAWLLHRGFLLDAQGQPADLHSCLDGSPSPQALTRCVTRRNLHWTLTYQPGSRYWTFQWIEFAGYLLTAIVLAAIAVWRIPRVTP